MPTRTNRRQFLKGTAAAATAGVVGYWVTGRKTWADELQSKSPNERINIAWCGIGGKGKSDVQQASKHGEIVALCDIDDHFLDEQAANYGKAKKFNDFREMFDKMGKDIDAVGVSTPDHTHALIALTAITMGKHVYCQKPMTHTVAEARLMRDAARKYKVSTQMGNQGTAEDGLRRAVEVIRAGGIGAVKTVHVWTNRPVWPQAGIHTLPEPKPVPENIHWDLFLGPAPERPYNPAYHPFKWRGYWDFGTGALGDMGCHTANLAFMALKLEHPTSVTAEHEELNPVTYPGWAHCTFEFPARGDMPPVTFNWYEGSKDGKLVHPPEELQAQVLEGMKAEAEAKKEAAAKKEATAKKDDKKPAANKRDTKDSNGLSNSGCIVVGEKGLLYSPNDYGANWSLHPHEAFKDYKDPEPSLPRNGKGDEGMKIEWLAAARGGPPAMSNFDYASKLTQFILLGNVAIKAGKKIEYDGENVKITNDPSLDKLLTQDYRKGFELPKV